MIPNLWLFKVNILAVIYCIDEFFSVVVTEGEGDGYSSARIVKKQIAARDRVKAAELLGKRYMLFTDKVNITGAVPVMIVGEEALEE